MGPPPPGASLWFAIGASFLDGCRFPIIRCFIIGLASTSIGCCRVPCECFLFSFPLSGSFRSLIGAALLTNLPVFLYWTRFDLGRVAFLTTVLVFVRLDLLIDDAFPMIQGFFVLLVLFPEFRACGSPSGLLFG